jgi:hypothetical protein
MQINDVTKKIHDQYLQQWFSEIQSSGKSFIPRKHQSQQNYMKIADSV